MSFTPAPRNLKNAQELWRFPLQINRPQCDIRNDWVFKRLRKLITKPLRSLFPTVIVKPGTISTNVPSQNFEVSKFMIEWQGSNTKQPCLRIFHSENSDESSVSIWESIPGENFIGGAKVILDITEERGSVEIDERKELQFIHQTVNDIQYLEDTLIISGSLYKNRHEISNNLNNSDNSYTLLLQLGDDKLNSDKELNFELKIKSPQVNQAHLRFITTADEHFYGFGEQFSRIDTKGYEIPIVCEEGGIGRGDPGSKALNLIGVAGEMFSSYAPAPHFLTNKGRSLFLINTEPSVFDLRNPQTASIRVFSNQMQGRIIAGDTPLDLIETYTAYVGRMPALPQWLNSGIVVGMQGGTAKVREVWQKLKKLDTPIAGFWLQDWVGQRKTAIGKQLWWNWQLDETTYPGWDQLVADLGNEGIAVGIYINSFLVNPPEDLVKGKRNLYQEAKELGFLVENEEGEIYLVPNTDFSAGLVDLSNSSAREWLKDVIKTEMLGIGAKFWMADFAEAAQFDGKFDSGESGISYHNQYPVDWVKVNREAIEESNQEGDAWFFNRAGYLKTPNYSTGMWLGDQNVTWKENDGMPSALKGMISGGMSGFSINHSDIGGYTSISYGILRLFGLGFKRSRELLYRWMEMNAFTPVFRTHEGNQPEENVQFYTDDDTLTTFSYWSKIYSTFANYRNLLSQEAASKGYPLVRHLFLHYPHDTNVYQLEDQFMLGSEFIIAPVLKPGAKKVKVYLPTGDWIHLWSNKRYSQGWHNISAPLGKPGVFYRHGSELAIEVVETLNQKGLI
ncbi:MAG: alpha-glucosidase [Cyanobacteria bacterium P01_A01_bin.84]